jgi:hypothetical protein
MEWPDNTFNYLVYCSKEGAGPERQKGRGEIGGAALPSTAEEYTSPFEVMVPKNTSLLLRPSKIFRQGTKTLIHCYGTVYSALFNNVYEALT